MLYETHRQYTGTLKVKTLNIAFSETQIFRNNVDLTLLF